MTGRSRTRLDRMRASLGIAQLALHQIEDDLKADDVDRQELTAILREVQEDIDVPGGLFPALGQLVSTAAGRAERIEPDRDGDASCYLYEPPPSSSPSRRGRWSAAGRCRRSCWWWRRRRRRRTRRCG
ncbi:hypothetical protein OG604_47925 [Streptomyces sp. NBC_01231]|nr:hypothetical protein OG604_47925 [Streptomyces sp. NBC_01231]